MSASSARRIDRDTVREAAAYPLPFTAGKIKALDQDGPEAAPSAAAVSALGRGRCFWSCLGCSDEAVPRTWPTDDPRQQKIVIEGPCVPANYDPHHRNSRSTFALAPVMH